MEKIVTLYHGSEKIVEAPEFGKGKEHNDFGMGFYCTESNDLAKEWAVSSDRNGFSNRYVINTEYTKILKLNSPEYSILNWIAVLLKYRVFPIKTPIAQRAKQYILDNFYINVNAYDIITGYRADDSYFDFAEAFVNNGLSVNQLAKAMRLGKLGEQVVIKSKYAFSLLEYQGFDVAQKDEYFVIRKSRDETANTEYFKIAEEDDDGLYVRDIVRGEIGNDDSRIPRNIS